MGEKGLGGIKNRGYVVTLGGSVVDGADCFKRTEEFEGSVTGKGCYCDEMKINVTLKGETSTFVKPASLYWTDR